MNRGAWRRRSTGSKNGARSQRRRRKKFRFLFVTSVFPLLVLRSLPRYTSAVSSQASWCGRRRGSLSRRCSASSRLYFARSFCCDQDAAEKRPSSSAASSSRGQPECEDRMSETRSITGASMTRKLSLGDCTQVRPPRRHPRFPSAFAALRAASAGQPVPILPIQYGEGELGQRSDSTPVAPRHQRLA